ncbi:MAG: helix-turn-helix domain-containing protein [Clostridia bacterium]|nr:helix-turn-helix domain-containing protein [Clostridia bacterium]
MSDFCKITPQLKINSMFSYFIRECGRDFVFLGETHNFYEVVCVLNGSVSITAGTEVYTLSAGSAIVHTPMEFHSVRAAEGTTPTIMVFSFLADAFPKLDRKIFAFTSAEETLLMDAWRMAEKAFYRVNYRLKLNEGRELEAQRCFDTLSLFLLRLFTNSTDVQTHRTSATAQTYSSIAAYINENLAAIQCVAQIADAFGISPVGLQKLFHTYTGSGVMHYVNHLKIARATEMLKSGSTSKATALALGFTDQNYFSTVFKRITGMSPTHYFKRSTQA